MARKINKPVPASAPSGADASADAAELEVLHPERTITLRDRTVEVREYGYIEGLRLQAGIQPFLDALFALFPRSKAPPSAEAVRAVFAAHVTVVHWMIAQAITPAPDDHGQPQAFMRGIAENVKWIGQLDDLEGDVLLSAWWGVNGGFFIRRLRERTLALQAAANPSPADASTPS